MMVACSGMARPIRNSALIARRNRLLCPARMIAYAAVNEMSTAGTTAPSVTITLLMKYRAKSDWMTSL